MAYPITATRTKKTTKKAQWKLYAYGLHRSGYYTYSGRVSKSTYKRIEEHCRKNHIRVKLDNGFGDRSADYRKTFFTHTRPLAGKWYICAYCGRIRSKEAITVDHLYPVSRAQKSIEFQKKMRRKGYRNINDHKNLVAACSKCNMKKGAKTGIWVVKGKIGRYTPIWVVRYAVRIAILSATGWCVLKLTQGETDIFSILRRIRYDFWGL